MVDKERGVLVQEELHLAPTQQAKVETHRRDGSASPRFLSQVKKGGRHVDIPTFDH